MNSASRENRSILVHKPDHLGDVLCAAPAIRRLRDAFPNARVVASAMSGPGRFLVEMRLADEILELPGPDWWKRRGAAGFVASCRRVRFDLAVNFRHDARDITSMALIGAKEVCTYTHRRFGSRHSFAAAPPSGDRAELLNHLALVRALGIATDFVPGEFRDRLAPTDVARFRRDGRWIAFHPFSRTRAKAWPIEHAHSFVRMAIDRGLGVRLIGAREHEGESERIGCDSPLCENLVGRTDVRELLCCIAAADALVCADSGPGHIAPLVGTPVVSIASGTNEHARWAPYGAVVLSKPVSCAPCHLETCPVPGHPCMNDLTPAAAMSALTQLPGFA